MTRNLIYHICPKGNYLWNLQQLRKYEHIFNGKKIAAITPDVDTDHPEVAETYLPGFEFIYCENSPHLRETGSFLQLLKKVESTNEDEITFYAHTKGVSRTKEKLIDAVLLWTECLYKYNLSDVDLVEELLTRYPMCGVFKRFGQFPHFPRQSKWHYSGTFFWFRNKDVFSKDWNNIVLSRYGTEAYLSLLFNKDKAAAIYPFGIGNLYNFSYTKKVAKHLERSWRKEVVDG